MRAMVTTLLALTLAGCASGPSWSAYECLDARQPVTRFNVVSPTEVVLRTGARSYQITTDSSCDLSRADRISFSNGPERLIGFERSTGPIYATQLYGGQICGRSGDFLVWRENFEDFRFPGKTCRVTQVHRLN